MHYFTIEKDLIVKQEVEALPVHIEELYAFARQKYVIDYEVDDWADDDTDQGTGYDFDNSFHVFREPKRSELVVCEGKLYGFNVGYNQILIPGENVRARTGAITKRHGSLIEWRIVEEVEPRPADHIYLLRKPAPSADYEFSPMDFPAGLVEAVEKKVNCQDTRGWFDNHARLMLKLTPEAIAEPDATLAAFADFQPMLVKVL